MSEEREHHMYYLEKPEKAEMERLSLIAFGSKHKWRKLAEKLGLSVDGVRLQMEAIVAYMTGGKNETKKSD